MEAKDRIISSDRVVEIGWPHFDFTNVLLEQDAISFEAGIKKVVDIVRDWETIPSEEFNRKYKVKLIDDTEDETFLEIIERYLGIDKPSSGNGA